ncbi:unnamed protein product [Peronospora belbahrii]|uniref:Ubiquitin-like domain-containing protein n=1 Tax=Peronospora belbahrii TaxID=622444 RepID=A0AAU9KRN1_9STRA|nr:unnamed protein product [Peronospora belbahrii]
MTDNLTIKIVSGTSESLQVCVDVASTTVLSLKELIEEKDAQRFPVSAQRLIFQGQILQDVKLLSEYHVTRDCALHLTVMPTVPTSTVAAISPSSQLRTFLQQMKDHEPLGEFTTAVQTLQKICRNIVDHPRDDKYRKLRLDNAVLRMKLFDRRNGQESVKLLGFQDGVQTGHLILEPTPEKWENLVACKAVVDSVATNLGGATPMAAQPFGAIPSMSARGDFVSQAQALLQNPAILQSIASNPMVQQMSQQNPILAQALQNPAFLAQSMQTLQQNPAMMQQMNQMMSSPNAMAQMQQMLTSGGMGGLGGYGDSPFGGAGPSSAATNPFAAGSATLNPFATTPLAPALTPSSASITSSPVASSSTADTAAADTAEIHAAPSSDNTEETFKEDEIANAIARSLQDQ